MPQDAITLNALTQELDILLKGGRVEKISQPENDELMLSIRSDKTRLLVISANPVNPRVHLTLRKKDNPYSAPSFLMLMRKYLTNARVKSVSLANFDRIIRIVFAARTELRDETTLCLYIELIGRYSNIILVGENGAVIDALRHIVPNENRRGVLPKLSYELPEQGKASAFDSAKVNKVLKAFCGGSLFDYLFRNISGFSPPTLNELLYSAGIAADATMLSARDTIKLSDAFASFANAFGSALFQPSLSLSQQKSYDDYFITPYKHMGKDFVSATSLNEAIDILYSEKDRTERLRVSGAKVSAAIKSALDKVQRRIKNALEKLEECELAEKYRLFGELITANIHTIKKGADKAEVEDYYNGGARIVVLLDPLLNAQQNAQRYYKKYAKLKRAETVSRAILKDSREEKNYILSVKQNLTMAESPDEILDIEAELKAAGYMRTENKVKKPIKKRDTAAAMYVVSGFTVLRGKNNAQNDKITFKMAKENDIWLHVKAYHGSHVIILARGEKVPQAVLYSAAEIAAYYSEQRGSTKAQVDYCARKFVKRHPSGGSGMVTYDNYETLTVAPDPHESKLLT